MTEEQEFLRHEEPPLAGLVVLDIDLGRDADGRYVNGADLVGGLRARGWEVLIVSGCVDRPGAATAIAAGAIGSAPKSRSFDVLLETVIKAASGELVLADAEHQGLAGAPPPLPRPGARTFAQAVPAQPTRARGP